MCMSWQIRSHPAGTISTRRRCVPLQTSGAFMSLRTYLLRWLLNLSDPGVEEALYDSAGMRQFVGVDLGREPVPDETTVCKFRHVLERHGLGERLFELVGAHLQQKGLRLNTGTIVDATIINAPSSTKNADQARDPEMHQTRKGKQWYFGMKEAGSHVAPDFVYFRCSTRNRSDKLRV